MLRKIGAPAAEDVACVLPSRERLRSGPVAIFECFEPIPCDPAIVLVPTGAVLPFETSTFARLLCRQVNGCGSCGCACLGLAVLLRSSRLSPEGACKRSPTNSTLPAKDQIVKVTNSWRCYRPGRLFGVQVTKSEGYSVVWLTGKKWRSISAHSPGGVAQVQGLPGR